MGDFERLLTDHNGRAEQGGAEAVAPRPASGVVDVPVCIPLDELNGNDLNVVPAVPAEPYHLHDEMFISLLINIYGGRNP
jgi:hypothetical protein